MIEYLKLVKNVLDNGVYKMDRTGTGTISVFGTQSRYNLTNGFPLVTTKKVHLKSIIHELLWFIRGDTNVKYLQDNGVTIWDEWFKPYTLDRPLVWVDKKSPDYVPFNDIIKTERECSNSDSEYDKLKNTWVKMMRRCYDPSSHNYHMYGGCGVSVCKRWHSFDNFLEDAKLIPHWIYKKNNWADFELDKDYYGANQYGPTTSVWLSSGENNMYMKTANVIKATNDDGEEFWGISQAHLCSKINMSTSTLSRFLKEGVPSVLKGKNKKFIGWEFSEAKLENKMLRLELIQDGELGPIYGKQWRSWETRDGTIDQLHNVIESLKHNPHSRRHIVSAWNTAEIDSMALPPCHALFQFFVDDEDRLSLQLYQRSADVFLGVPFNIASYSLLLMMVAQVTGYTPYEFVHTIGDAHLYVNHIEQAKLQLSREPLELPIMKLNNKITSIDGFKYEDFELYGYNHYPAIKAEIAV